MDANGALSQTTEMVFEKTSNQTCGWTAALVVARTSGYMPVRTNEADNGLRTRCGRWM